MPSQSSTRWKIGAYIRLSREDEDMRGVNSESVETQKRIIDKHIKGLDDAEFVGYYIDDGYSGTSLDRPEFLRLQADFENKVINCIIVKDLSRLARNNEDAGKLIFVIFPFYNIRFISVNDKVDSFLNPSSVHNLTIHFKNIMNDEYSRDLSKKVRSASAARRKKGEFLGAFAPYGYKKDTDDIHRLVIDEEQAAMVRELYELYATDEYSLKQIERIFWDKGYRNYNGNKIAHTTMSNIISNPKYKGYYVGNKVHIIDMFTKKQKFLPPEEWVMFKDESGEIVPAIVSEELWDKANAVLARRSNDVKARQGICNHPNLLTGKLFCTCCNKPYYRKATRNREDADNSRWVCSGKINNGAASCDSFTILEGDIKPILYDVLQETKASADALIEEYAAMYKETLDENDLSDRIARAEQAIKLIKGKKSKLLEYNVQGKIDDSDFLAMTSSLNEELKEQENLLAELIQQRDSSDEFASHIKSLRDVLIATENEIKDGVIDKTFINKYIDKIYVTPVSETEMRLEIKIFTGETTEKYFQKLCSRTGHTSKKMIETAEKNMK